MKKGFKIVIVLAVCVAIIITGLALYVDSKLSQIEKNEKGQESAEQIAKESLDVISGKPHSESAESEENESAEQREKERTAEP